MTKNPLFGTKVLVKKFSVLILIFLLLRLFSAPLKAYGQEDFKKGEIIDKVICLEKPEQSYALFLPAEYTPEKKWPILFAFDPGARGILPLQHFQEAAEKYQYIVIGSHNARNGPWEPVFQAMAAVWNDAIARFSIDPDRIYATGFSGGARAAVYFPKIIRLPIRGIIGCGAGLPPGMKADEIKPCFYLGIVGDGDFNYLEMKILDQQLDAPSIAHRFLVFAGSHVWPPPNVCKRALGWLEIVGMENQIREVDEDLIGDIYNAEVQTAQTLEESGRIFQAVQEYEVIDSTFHSLRDTHTLKDKVLLLKKGSEFDRWRKQEDEHIQKEKYGFSRYLNILTQIEKEALPLHLWYPLFRKLGISEWQKTILQNNDKEEGARATRLLFGLETEARSKGWFFLDKGDFQKAILFFEIAVRANAQIKSRLRYLYYYLACAYALGKASKQAIHNLNLAVENGFEDWSALESEERLAFIKQSSEFQQIINNLKQKKTGITVSRNHQKFLAAGIGNCESTAQGWICPVVLCPGFYRYDILVSHE